MYTAARLGQGYPQEELLKAKMVLKRLGDDMKKATTVARKKPFDNKAFHKYMQLSWARDKQATWDAIRQFLKVRK
jgi:hypothetical protein